MLLLLLSLVFNPLGLLLRWLPALYLAAWPIIIQTLGHDALMLHAILLVLFILTRDITSQLSLRLLGFDLISLPAGIFLLATLLSNRGSQLLSIIIPLCSTLMVAIEPVFLIIEAYIVMEMVKTFNKWLGKMSNVRDDNSRDLSSWEPPLAGSSIAIRFVVILITLASYITSYMLIQDSKLLLAVHDQQIVPIQFKHAIALLVTLQLIALTATIYKEEGILSQSGMVAATATIPIFIASWSYYNLKNEVNYSSQSKTIFPFELFTTMPNMATLKTFTLDKLAAYYFGPDFWYILGARLVCLVWYFTFGGGVRSTVALVSRDDRDADANQNDNLPGTPRRTSGRVLGQLNWWLVPISKRTLIKIIFVLAYAQMLAQQMDNRRHLEQQTASASSLWITAEGENENSYAKEQTLQSFGFKCCGGGGVGGDGDDVTLQQNNGGPIDNLFGWLACMWESARNCASGNKAHVTHNTPSTGSVMTSFFIDHQQPVDRRSRAVRYLEVVTNFSWQFVTFVISSLAYVYHKLITTISLAPTSFMAIHTLWLSRWRSPIIQRLMQSIFIHLYYIFSLIGLDNGDGDNDD